MALEAGYMTEEPGPGCAPTEHVSAESGLLTVCIMEGAEWDEKAGGVKQESSCHSADQSEPEFQYDPLEPECLLQPDEVPCEFPEATSAAHAAAPARAASPRHEYQCDACRKTYKWKLNLIQHIKVMHLRQATYSCETCKKEFSHMGNLKRHKLVHTGEKPYSCEICQRQFAELSNLKVHHRIHTGIKPYTCEICKKEFKHLSHFNSHKRVHTGEKRFTCDICDNKFARLGYLNMHKRIHTGEKPFICERCKKTFSQNRYLKKHQCAGAHKETS